jgi:hypothetical protein
MDRSFKAIFKFSEIVILWVFFWLMLYFKVI